ncbi:MAG: hypothetical protein RSG52_09380 [Terrisporobacter sp.]|uniref:hypothetical protein n=1 Tax=Terrisporobacter sp. TaxID=1965305 RepID=UPI002FC5F8CA
MKLFKMAALIFVICFMTTGCDISSDSPENLLNDDIVYSESKNKLYTFVNQSLDGTTLLLPENSSEVGEINELGSNIIAFQKKQDVNDNSSKVGFILISKDKDNFKLKDNILLDGKDIEYANFYDLNNDGNDEVVLLINTEKGTTMYVYSVVDSEIELISKVQPTWLDNYLNYTNTKIKIGFFDDDLKLDILMMNIDNKNNTMFATILNLDNDNKVKKSNAIEFKDVNSSKDLYIVSGKVFNNKKGIILSIPTNKDNMYITQIITFKNNKITVAFNEDNMIKNSYYVPIRDMDLDGVLEIPVLNNTMIDSFVGTSASIPTTSALVNWKKWNNKEDNDAGTIFISQVYYNYKNNFRFFIPNTLANKLYIKKNVIGDATYYTFNYYEKDDKQPVEIFQIGISPKNLVEDAKATPKLETILAETENNYYQLIVNDKEVFEKYNLTVDNIKEYFSLIYK